MKHHWELDKLLSISGIFLATILVLVSSIKTNPWFIISGITLFLVCVAYLYIRRDKEFSYTSELQTNRSIYLLLNILFFSVFCFNLISLYFRVDPYVRPLSYFISIVAMISILMIEILFLPRNKTYTCFVLLKIILIPLSIVWSQSLIFPTVLGDDPWWHQWFTYQILDSGFVPGGEGYSKLPAMHLMTGITSLVTGLDYKIATLLSISSMQIICCLLFAFLLGRFAFNAKVGLLAALLLGVSNQFIRFSWWTIPQTLGGVLILIIIYLLFAIRQRKPVEGISLFLLLAVALILTHTLASACMAFLLFVFWAGFKIYRGADKEKRNTSVTIITAVLFSVAMLGWWIYASGDIETFVRVLNWGFGVDYGILPHAQISEEMIPFSHETSFLGRLFDSGGMLLFWALSLPAIFYMFSGRVEHSYSINIVATGIILLGLIFIAILFGWDIYTGRWFYFSQILLAIPLAVSLFLFSARIKRNSMKTLMIVTTIAALSFLMVMSPTANMDNPLLKDTVVRRAYTESELQAFETISELLDKKAVQQSKIGQKRKADSALNPKRSKILGAKNNCGTASKEVETLIQPPLECFFTKDFNDYKDSVIIIMKKISQSTIRTGTDWFVKLDYDPNQLLTEEGFSHIYECGSVSAFCFK